MLKYQHTVKGTPISLLTRGSEQRVQIVCDTCGVESDTSWVNYRKAQERRGDNGMTVCRACSCKKTASKRRGQPAHNSGKRLPFEKRRRSPFLSPDGYKVVFVPEEYSYLCSGNSGWRNYKKEHIFLIERHLGRRLSKFEEVHHIDGDKLNNQMDNLVLLDGASHKGIHQSLQDIAYQLVQRGFIEFDHNTTSYRVAHLKLRELLEHPAEDNQQPSP